MKIKVPKIHPVQPLRKGQRAKDKVTCGTCGLSWDDAKVTSMTPAPSGRCPFEQFHAETQAPTTTVWLVMQQGGSSTEWYAHWFDSLEDAEDYREDADKHTYDTLEPEEIKLPEFLSGATGEQINEILFAFGDALESTASGAVRC